MRRFAFSEPHFWTSSAPGEEIPAQDSNVVASGQALTIL